MRAAPLARSERARVHERFPRRRIREVRNMFADAELGGRKATKLGGEKSLELIILFRLTLETRIRLFSLTSGDINSELSYPEPMLLITIYLPSQCCAACKLCRCV